MFFVSWIKNEIKYELLNNLLIHFKVSKGNVFLYQAYVYDGKTAEKVGELGSPSAHNGGIYAVSAIILISSVNNKIWRSLIEIS